jgi:hypothetical protein
MSQSRRDGLEQRRRRLSERQRALLEARLSGRAATAPVERIARSEESSGPLSVAQERMWVLGELYPRLSL